MNEIKNYGLVINKQDDPKAYKLGAIELPKEILVQDGQWDKYLPDDESQVTPTYDTYGCTVFGTENIFQILEKQKLGNSQEYDERYIYNLAKINPPGADPHDVAESFRGNGQISGELPMTNTYEEYKTPRPMLSKYIQIGIEHPYELRHQWLWRGSLDKGQRTKLIMEHLKYSPLAVSVTAWKLSNGVYVDNGQPNTHWTVLYGFTDKGWKIYDSYAPHKKILSFDHNIEVCKRYQLVLSTRKQQLSVFQSIVNVIKNIVSVLFDTVVPPNPVVPSPVITPQPELIKPSITDMAKAIELFEGYFEPSAKYPKGSASWRNKNPGNLKNTKGGFLQFLTYEAGFFALCDYIKRVGQGKHTKYPKRCDIKRFFEIYAPTNDSNNPSHYALFVADRLNVGINFLIEELKGIK